MFAAMIEVLASSHASQWSHAELEEHVLADGRELLRLMYQDHLELRARTEERRAVVTGADAVAHTRVEPGHSRALTTVFGTVTVERMAYRAPGWGICIRRTPR